MIDISRLDDWFVDNWRKAWKLLSVQYQAVSTALLLALQLGPIFPPQVRDAIPQPWASIATVVWFGLWLVTRLKAQKSA